MALTYTQAENIIWSSSYLKVGLLYLLSHHQIIYSNLPHFYHFSLMHHIGGSQSCEIIRIFFIYL